MGLLAANISLTSLPVLHYSPPHPNSRRHSSFIITCSHSNPNNSADNTAATTTTTTTTTPTVPVDRRGLLLGLGGGLYSMSTQTPAPARAAPPSSLPHCHFSISDSVVDYQFPSLADTPLRVRRPAHLVDGDFVAKYKEGLRRMKALPESHPWNFYTLAKNHALHVHDTWHFLPWHRMYIYFFERVVGKLIDDETFALPFWNFDAPEGMAIPSLFVDPASPLYSPARDPAHAPPAVLDFWYVYGAETPGGEEERRRRAAENVEEIRRAFRQSMGRAELFVGGRAEEEGGQGSAGRLDSIHKGIHQWVGPPAAPWMEMGNPHSSPRDPVFYSLHSNVDRLWQIYRNFRGNGPDFDDDEWLDTAYTFHDENGRHVRVKVRDCLDPLKLRYTYAEVANPWVTHRPKVKFHVSRIQPVSSHEPVTEFGSDPKPLHSPVRILLARPKNNRTNLEKGKEVEVLHITGIDVVPSGPARFDVYVATHGSSAGSGYGEFAGSFIKPIPVHRAEELEGLVAAHAKGKQKKGSLKLGITSVIEDLEAEDAEQLVVTLVPTDGKIAIGGIGIKLLPTDRHLLL